MMINADMPAKKPMLKISSTYARHIFSCSLVGLAKFCVVVLVYKFSKVWLLI